MSDQESSDDELALQLVSFPDPAGKGLGRGPSTGMYPLKTVVRQQQDNAKTCRLLALEVGSLKAELTREQKKRAQAVSRATAAEAAHRHAEQRLNELLYSNSKLQQELTAAKEAAGSTSRRVQSLRQSLADAEAEAQEKRVLGQQQVGLDRGLAPVALRGTCGQRQDRSMLLHHGAVVRPHTTLLYVSALSPCVNLATPALFVPPGSAAGAAGQHAASLGHCLLLQHSLHQQQHQQGRAPCNAADPLPVGRTHPAGQPTVRLPCCCCRCSRSRGAAQQERHRRTHPYSAVQAVCDAAAAAAASWAHRTSG